jgi:hypothetical protein
MAHAGTTAAGSGAARLPAAPQPEGEDLLEEMRAALADAERASKTGYGMDQALAKVEAIQQAIQDKFGVPVGDATRADLEAGKVSGSKGDQLAAGNVIGPSGQKLISGNVLAARTPAPARSVAPATAGAPPAITGRPAAAAPGPFTSELAARGDIRADADADILAATRSGGAGPGTQPFPGIGSAPDEGTLTPDSELLGIPRAVDKPLTLSSAGSREDIVSAPIETEGSFIDSPAGELISSVARFGEDGAELPHEQRQQMLASFLAESGPVDMDLGNVPIEEQLGSNATGTLRKRIGMSEEFYTPERSGFLERFGRGLVSRSQIGSAIGEAPGSRFKDVKIEDILNDPLMAEEWAKLTDQEKAMVMFDSSDKAADALSLPQDKWDRFFGKSSSFVVNKQVVNKKMGGAVTSAFNPVGSGGAPAPVAAGTGGGRAPAGQPGIKEGDLKPQPRLGGRVGAGALAYSLGLDLGDLDEWTVTSDAYENPRASSVLMTEREVKAGGYLRRGEIERAGENPNEYGNFLLVDSIGQEGAPVIVRKQNRAAQATPGFFEEYVRMSKEGKMVDVVQGEGAGEFSRKVPIEFALLRPDLYRTERARGPKMVTDTEGRTFAVTEDELYRAEPGELRSEATRSTVTTKTHVERQVALKASLTMTGDLLQRYGEIGPGGLGWAGFFAVFGGQVIKFVTGGRSVDAADRWSRWASGGTLTATELDATRKEGRAWVSQRRETLVGDKRLTDKDRVVLEGFISRGEAFADPEAVKMMMVAFTKYEVILNELELAATGEALQYPARTQEELDTSLDALMGFGFPADEAMDILRAYKNYPELRSMNIGAAP